MKSAKEILMEKATKNNDGFLSGQPRWIIEAMEEYANQFKPRWVKASEDKPKDSGYYFVKSKYGQGSYFFNSDTGLFKNGWNDDFDNVKWLDETKTINV